jgi:hypothetical protein
MTASDRAALIARYKAGYDRVVEALRGIGPEELNWRPAPGEWSAREVVHHLADSETNAALRLRRLLAEDQPVIHGYDQEDYARRFRYQERPMEPSLQAFQAARGTTGQVIDLMDEADWARAGTHSESGPYSVTRWLEIYAAHAEIHARQIQDARAAFAARRR